MYSEVLEFVWMQIAQNGRPSAPYRDRFQHTLRVVKWAERLHEFEGGDIEVIRLAALFHDVGWDPERPHEEVGAELTRDYLATKGFSPEKARAIVEAVAHHNHRDDPGPFSVETLIIQDADFLDEVGVLTLVWDSLAAAFKPNPSYAAVYERAQRSLAELKELRRLLRTPTGRRFYDKRLKILEKCLTELEFELRGYST